MIRKTAIAAFAAATVLLTSGCGVGEAKVPEVTPVVDAALPVETTTPVRADIVASYQTTSTLESDSDAPVRARVAGEVTEIHIEEGDWVKAGQLLARLDGEQLRLEMLEAKANLDKVRREHDRLVGLQERGLVSEAMYEGLKFDIDALEATYELKRLNFEYTRVRAPIDGVVSSRDIKVGQQVGLNEPTFRIVDTSKLVAHLKIPQTELAKFRVGHRIKLRVDAAPETRYAAIIDRISPTIDTSNGTFKATAYVDNGDGELAPGMFARFDVAYEIHEDAIVVPSSAVIKEDSIAVVYVVADGQAERRRIQTGIENDEMTEVLSGLDLADQIVVNGQAGLRDGSPVLASNTTTAPVGG